MTRTLYAAIGLIALVFGSLSVALVVAQFSVYPAPTSIAVWSLVLGIPLALGVMSQWAPIPVMRKLATVSATAFFAAIVAAFAFPTGPLPAAADIPWIITFTGLPALCVAAVTRDSRVIWGYAVIVCALGGVIRGRASAEPNAALTGFEDALYSLLLVSVVVGLALSTKRAAARLDAAVVAARRDHAERAARVSRKQERLTIDAIVHDSVISTLLLAGRSAVPSDVLSRHASSTLAQLDALGVPHPERTVRGDDFVTRLVTAVADLDDAAVLHHDIDDSILIPPAAATAMLGAVSEALRNSVTGAQGTLTRPVRRTIEAQATEAGVRITVSDDGVGFDLACVPAERLGISQSIIGRMQRVNGGAAVVRTQPGHGTEVDIEWSAS